jgi:DNA-directed RNA polymerase specialized sigma24 family protein
LLDEDRPDSRDAFSHVDNREMVWKLVGALTPEQQEAVRLKFAGELSAKEIGLVMKKSIPAVGMLLSRAMQSLRAAAGNEVV